MLNVVHFVQLCETMFCGWIYFWNKKCLQKFPNAVLLLTVPAVVHGLGDFASHGSWTLAGIISHSLK